MQLTPTVISAQPMEKAIREYLDRHDHVKIDPALVSAPLITTLVDATGLAIYLLIAKGLLSALR
jgi:Divalent cation transporter